MVEITFKSPKCLVFDQLNGNYIVCPRDQKLCPLHLDGKVTKVEYASLSDAQVVTDFVALCPLSNQMQPL